MGVWAQPAPMMETRMEVNFEAIALMVLSTVITSSREVIDQKADQAADRIIAAVNDSETKLDNAAAKELARVLKRVA